MRELALDLGATEEELLLEERSQNTVGNARECYKLITTSPNLSNLRSFKIVTSAYHSLRAEMIFRRHFPTKLDLHSHPSSYGITRNNWRQSREGIKLVGKEVMLIGKLIAAGYRMPRSFDET